MKSITLLTVFLSITSLTFAQTKINFDEFSALRYNQQTEKVESVREINEKGYLEINKQKSSIIVYSQSKNQKELFEFTPFKKVSPPGHFIAFGTKNTQHMFNFVPEDKVLFIKVNDVILFQFELSNNQVQKVKRELK